MNTDNLLGIFIAISVSVFVIYIAKLKNKIVQKILHWLPPILLTFLIPGILSFIFDLSLENIPLHNWSKDYIYPITIFCIMSSMSLAQLKIVGLRPLLLFLVYLPNIILSADMRLSISSIECFGVTVILNLALFLGTVG